jgi:hypothetical protein
LPANLDGVSVAATFVGAATVGAVVAAGAAVAAGATEESSPSSLLPQALTKIAVAISKNSTSVDLRKTPNIMTSLSQIPWAVLGGMITTDFSRLKHHSSHNELLIRGRTYT